MPGPTPSQTIGPFFSHALLDEDLSKLIAPDHASAIRIEGAVYDGAGDPVPDAMLEIWQADPKGRYAHSEDKPEKSLFEEGFTGFGRSGTDDSGKFVFTAVKPGSIPGPENELQAPHILVSVFARGLLKRLVTRIYFPDEDEANARDPVLSRVEDSRLRESLIARAVDGVSGGYRFDIHLRGEKQTAFFDV